MRIVYIFFIAILGLGASNDCIPTISMHYTPKGVEVDISYDKSCKSYIQKSDANITVVITYPKENQINQSSSNDTTLIDNIIATAKSKLGSPYNPAHAGPDSFDCSGFVYYVFRQNGIKIPRTSRGQSLISKRLNKDEIKRGDIVVFDTAHRGHINHSGIYLGNGKFIHATSGRAYSVTISNLEHGFYKDKFRWGVRVVSKSQKPN